MIVHMLNYFHYVLSTSETRASTRAVKNFYWHNPTQTLMTTSQQHTSVVYKQMSRDIHCGIVLLAKGVFVGVVYM